MLDSGGVPAHTPDAAVTTYFARSLGLAQLALGLVTVVLTGSLPLTSAVESMLHPPPPLSIPISPRS